MIRLLDPIGDAGLSGGQTMSAEDTPARYHEPVLLAEVIRFLEPAAGRVFVDGTLGGGGHTAALLDAGAKVIGIDRDPEAIAWAQQRLAGCEGHFTPVNATFAQASDVLAKLGITAIDGALLDLGVSSRQLDSAERGFSFMQEGPLDMRMNPREETSASDLVNTASGEQLERIFREFGEEPAARRVAARITRDRVARPFATTFDLVRSVEAVIPRRSGKHPATRIFQALRIAVNRELEMLGEGLEQLSALLRPGGRLAVITFHSLEDRIVKAFFRRRSVETIDRPEWPAARPNPDLTFRSLTHKPVVASTEEQSRNPRARSAKLRVVEKL